MNLQIGCMPFFYSVFAPEILWVYFIGRLAFFNAGFESLWFIRGCWHGAFPRDKRVTICSLDLDMLNHSVSILQMSF